MIELRINKIVSGIYCYRSKETGEIVYIGKDKYLNRMHRHKQHIKVRPHTRKYRIQKIDINLHKFPDKYVYEELCYVDINWLDEMEYILIKKFSPSFNIVDNK